MEIRLIFFKEIVGLISLKNEVRLLTDKGSAFVGGRIRKKIFPP